MFICIHIVLKCSYETLLKKFAVVKYFYILYSIYFNRKYSDTHIAFYINTYVCISTTSTPQLSSAYFHQSLPLTVFPVESTQPSLTSSKAALSKIISLMSQSYSLSMCTAAYQQPAVLSICYPHYKAIYLPLPVT